MRNRIITLIFSLVFSLTFLLLLSTSKSTILHIVIALIFAVILFAGLEMLFKQRTKKGIIQIGMSMVSLLNL